MGGSGGVDKQYNRVVWKNPNPIVDTIATPVSTTLYDIFNKKNIRLKSLACYVQWTVQPTPLDILLTKDNGTPVLFTVANPVSVTYYFPAYNNTTTNQYLVASDSTITTKAFIEEARNLKIEIRTTGGTVQNLHYRINYQKM